MTAEELADAGGPIVFFDGECNLCNGAVDFCLRHEAGPVLRFAALQSAVGGRLAGEYAAQLSSIVLYENGRIFTRSDAALRVAAYLRPPWRAVTILRYVPRILRDAVYAGIARNRYRIFGRRSTCRMPDPGLRARFLE